jgi:hypothetical protein
MGLASNGSASVVIRNTFLEFSNDESHADQDPSQPRRVRSVSDMTGCKLPVKVELANSGGYCQVARHRLSSSFDDVGGGLVRALGKEVDAAHSHCDGVGSLKLPTLLEEPSLGKDLHLSLTGLIAEKEIPLQQMLPPRAHTDSIGRHSPWMPPAPASPQQLWNQLVLPPSFDSGMLPADKHTRLQGPPPGSLKGRNLLNLADLLLDEGSQQPCKTMETSAVKQDAPTTVMLRNIPTKYTRQALLGLLDIHGFAGLYDFVYLPIDFRNGVNLGYAFVNSVLHEDALRLLEHFNGLCTGTGQNCEVSWACPNQGLKDYVERYRNSPVMHPSMPDEYKPMVFRNGRQVDFPLPTKPIKAPKLRLMASGRSQGQEAVQVTQAPGQFSVYNVAAVCA